MLVRVLTIAVVVTCASSVASAAVISADHPDFGVGALTRDTDQGLDFLDVTFTDQSTSYNTIHEVRGTAGLPPYPNFAAGGAFEGFRYATAPEVYALIGNSGFSPAILDEAENKGNELSGLFDLLGMAPNASLVFPRRIHGQTGTPDPQVGGKYRAVLMMDVRDPGVLDVVDTRFGAQPSTTADIYGTHALIASFLVQDSPAAGPGPASPAPEPSSLVLLGIGACGLIGYARRRRRAVGDHAGSA